MIYLLLIIIFLYPILTHMRVDDCFKSKYYWFECVCLIIVAGFRYQVGGDTFGYMADWDFMPNLKEINASSFLLTRYQPLWVVINAFAKSLNEEFFVLQIIEAAIINIATFYIICKASSPRNVFHITLIYMLSSFLFFNCEIMREAISIGLFYIAFNQLINHNYLRYFLIITVAFFIHDSAVILFLVPLFLKFLEREISIKTIFICFLVSLLVSRPYIMSFWVNYLPGARGETFLNKYGAMEIGSILGIIRSIIFVLLYYYLLKIEEGRLSKMTEYGLKIFLILRIFGIAMPIFSSRLCNFFTIFFYIAIADAIVENFNRRRIVSYVFIMMLSFSTYRYYFNDVTKWVTSSTTSTRYHFYELFYPYYSIFDDPDPEIISRRKAIYHQEELNNSL